MKIPKEKAEELVEKMLNAQEEPEEYYGAAVRCALLAIDEILLHEKNNHSCLDKSYEYWQEVKQELEIMK